MIDEPRDELAALYALDLLEGAELKAFEEALAQDPSLREDVRRWREAAAAMAHAAPAAVPPPALKARILDSAGKRGVPRPISTAKHLSFPALFPWAAAAAFALAAAWMGMRYFSASSENRALRDQQRLAEAELQSSRNELEAERIIKGHELAIANEKLAGDERRQADSDRQLAELSEEIKSREDLAEFKIATLASMLGNSPQALAVAVWDPARQKGVLTVSKLPALASDKDYQLWVIDPQYPSPVSGGVFTVDPASGEARVIFKADKPVKFAAKFAVSLERKGGVRKAEGPIVLLSE